MDVTPAPVAPRHRRTAVRVGLVAVLTAATAVVATGAFGPTTPPAAADGLRPFDDCAQVRDWYVDALRPLVGPYGIGTGGPWEAFATEDNAGGGERAAGAVGPQSAEAAVGNGATGTNLQEVGVDEPDVMKVVDGRLFTTVGDRLVVLDVTGARPREIGSLAVPALGAAHRGWSGDEQGPVPADPGTAELLVAGDRVVLLSSGWHEVATSDGPADGRAGMWPAPAGSTTTTTTVVDVSDADDPRLVSQQEVEGSLVGARLSDGVVRVVTTSTPSIPPASAPPADLPGGFVDKTWEAAATEANLLALERMSGEQFLPHVVVRGDDGAVTGRTPALACADVAHPSAAAGAGMLTVRSLDPQADDDPVGDVTAVATDGEMLYASADRLYVATTRGGWATWTGARLDDAQQEQPPSTELHGFSTEQGAATSYLASGEVQGVLLGRWAMSARDGRLRVASTTGAMWGGAQSASESFVTVLAERGGELVEEGQVGGLGPGETIRAVRWFDDVAVVVTFRQTDPLYVVDLSDAAAPSVTGELKVPGYSAYLHPVGDGRLVGVGQDATDQGQTTGVLVQTFDLADPAVPTQVDTWTEAGTWTSVESDSRQFSYLPEQRMALMPLDTMSGRSAVQAFTVGQDGTLADAGRYDLSGQGYRWLVRAMPVGDAVAVLTGGEQGAAITLLDLTTLAETGSVDLG
jgi:hypothetical protein